MKLGRRSGLLGGRRSGFLLAPNSRLPNRKVWEGGNGGGAHDPLRGIAGNSREPKRIILPWLTAGAANGLIETIRSPKQ
jgi:hypothetical protein